MQIVVFNIFHRLLGNYVIFLSHMKPEPASSNNCLRKCAVKDKKFSSQVISVMLVLTTYELDLHGFKLKDTLKNALKWRSYKLNFSYVILDVSS